MPTRIFMKNQKMLRLAIGRNSLKIRKSAGYSQCEFAKAIGVSKRTYEGYERRETTMPMRLRMKYTKNLEDMFSHWMKLKLPCRGLGFYELIKQIFRLDQRYSLDSPSGGRTF